MHWYYRRAYMIAQDIKMTYSPNTMDWDITWSGNDLLMEPGLETAVEMSLFTDRRANDDDTLPDNNTDKRGWWGDVISPVEDNDQMGSRLWLLRRCKATNENLRLAEDYAKESLEWMVTDGVVAKLECNAFRMNETLGLQVTLYRSDGSKVMLTYNQLWEAT